MGSQKIQIMFTLSSDKDEKKNFVCRRKEFAFEFTLAHCLHITSKRLKVPLIKMVTLTVRVNEALTR